MDVSIIIVNWNTRDILHSCLQSIYERTGGIEFEVIVIDNGSSDNSVQMVKQLFPQVVLIKNSENKGFAAANNQGIAIAKGRYTLLLNSDTVILNNAIGKTISFADAHPEAAVIGCLVLNKDRSLQPTCFMFPSLLNKVLFVSYLYKFFPKSNFFGRERMTWWDRSDVREVDVVTGCFMLVRREAIEQVGLMDEQFFMYGEETDWSYRFMKAGWKNMFYPGAQIIHYGNVSAVKHGANRAIMRDRSDIWFMFKYWPKWKAWLGVVLKFMFYLSRLPGFFLLFVIKRKRVNHNIIGNHLAGLKELIKHL